MAPRGVAETVVAHVRFLLLLAAAFLQLLLCAGAAQGAADEAIVERRIKAAYLYRFAGYVTWPDGVFAAPDSPLAIGIWGNDGLADDLAALVQLRTIDNRRIEVRRVREPESLAGLHVLFVGHARNARLAEAAAGSQSRATLVVTETPGACALYGFAGPESGCAESRCWQWASLSHGWPSRAAISFRRTSHGPAVCSIVMEKCSP
jgi:hypothetical protein